MKIYHTETQADYDALMVELEGKGYVWASRCKPTESKDWTKRKENTCVRISNKRVTRNSIIFYKVEYPNIPIIKYKAKVDERMKFTKENVGKLFNEHDKYICFSLDDLQDEILKLDDTPEKVVVPKYVAEWIEWNKGSGVRLHFILRCYADFSCGKEPDVYREWLKAVRWYVDNPYKFIQAYENGYTVEPEQLYYIPLPHLETSDGTKQVLSKRKGYKNYFAHYPTESLQQEYTKAELEQVPEIYRLFAVPVEEEAE